MVPGNGTQLDGTAFMNNSSNTEKLVAYYNNIRTNIWTYVPPVILTVGIFSNVLALAIWIRSLVKKRGSSSNYFFACLAVADIIALLFVPMYDHVGKAYYGGLDLRNYSNFLCKFYSFMFAFSMSFSSYTLASLTLFRMIGVIYPHRYKQICSARNAKIVIISIIVFTIVVHIQTLFRNRLVDTYDRGPVCIDPTRNKTVRLFLIFWMMLVLYIVPMFIIVLSNACIVWKLLKRRLQSIGTTTNSAGDHAFAGTVKVLIAVSLLYVITMLPMWIYIVFRMGTEGRGATDPVEVAKNHLGWAIVANISLLNSMGNFWVYCFSHPQFVPDVKSCFQAVKAQISSAFCRRTNEVESMSIYVGEARPETASTSGTLTKSRTFNTTATLEVHC